MAGNFKERGDKSGAVFSRALSKAWLALALAVTVAGAAVQARAQDPQSLPPPIYSSVDPQGVDLASGRFNISLAGLSIGPADRALNLTFVDLDLHDNLRGVVQREVLNSAPHSPMVYTVTLGTRSAKFLGFPAGPYTLYGGDGAQSLADGGAGLTYTDADGTVATFAYEGSDHWHVSTITRPDGEILTYTYVSGGNARQSVVSSLGYMLHYDWSGTGLSARLQKITALNLAVDACAPAAVSCTFTRSWPALTFTVSGLTATFTDNLNRTTVVTARTGTTGGIQRPGGAATTLTFGSSSANFGVNIGRIISLSNGQATWTYSYDWVDPNATLRTLVTTATDPLGHAQVVKARTDLSAASYYKNALNEVTAFDLELSGNGMGRTKAVLPPTGGRTDYAYDARNNLTTVVRTSSTSSETISVSADFSASCTAYKVCNKPNFVLDARNNRTDYTYDPQHGGMLTITKPAGDNGVRPQTRYTYAQFTPRYFQNGVLTAGSPVWRVVKVSTCATMAGEVTVNGVTTPAACTGTADETVTTFAYEPGGGANNVRLLSVTTRAGDNSLSAATSYTYNELGDVISIDGPLPGAADTARTYYDAMRQAVGEVGPAFTNSQNQVRYSAKRITYNADGQVTLTELGTTTNQSDTAMSTFDSLQQGYVNYDSLGRKVSQSQQANAASVTYSQFGYDAANRPICQSVRMNPAAFTSAATACALGTLGTDGPDRVTYTEYDALNRVTKVTSGYGATAPNGPRVEKVLTYGLNGKEATVRDGKDNLTTYEYDGFDRLVKARYPNPSTPLASSCGLPQPGCDYDQYSYDSADNRTSWRRRDGASVAFAYDALNRARTGLRGETYGYDNRGRKTSAAYAGQTASATFDALGRTVTETTNGLTMSYEYDLAGHRTKIAWPDAPTFYVTYTYDNAGKPTGVWEAGTTQLASYSYDDLGRAVSRWYGNGVGTGYGYDAISRLTVLDLNLAGTDKDQHWTFDYSPASQVRTRAAGNSLYEWSGVQTSKGYEVNGLNQVTKAAGASIGHDLRGNLNNDGSKTYSYDLLNNLTGASDGAGLSYEPTGRLWSVSAGGVTTKFLYSGSDLVAEYGASGLTRRYVPGPGTDAPIVWYEGSGTGDRRWLQADPRGSIVAVTNGAGALVGGAPNTYDEYGVPAAGNLGRFQYTGQVWLPEVGLYHYKARAYSPTLGRFMQTDPIGYSDGLNWYAYVGNDPVNRNDPSGLIWGSIETAEGESPNPTEPVEVNSCSVNAICYGGDEIAVLGKTIVNDTNLGNDAHRVLLNAALSIGGPGYFGNVGKAPDGTFFGDMRPDLGNIGGNIYFRKKVLWELKSDNPFSAVRGLDQVWSASERSFFKYLPSGSAPNFFSGNEFIAMGEFGKITYKFYLSGVITYTYDYDRSRVYKVPSFSSVVVPGAASVAGEASAMGGVLVVP